MTGYSIRHFFVLVNRYCAVFLKSAQYFVLSGKTQSFFHKIYKAKIKHITFIVIITQKEKIYAEKKFSAYFNFYSFEKRLLNLSSNRAAIIPTAIHKIFTKNDPAEAAKLLNGIIIIVAAITIPIIA